MLKVTEGKGGSQPFQCQCFIPSGSGQRLLGAVLRTSEARWEQRRALFSIPARIPLREQLLEAKPSQHLLFLDSPTILDSLSGYCFLSLVTLNLKNELQSPPIGTQRNLPLSP